MWLRSLFLGLAQASAQHFYQYAELPTSKRHQEARLLEHPVPLRRTKETSKNPFAHTEFYVNPVNALEYNKSIETAHGKVKHNLQKMQHVPSAYWIDRKAKIRGKDLETLEGILKDASKKKVPELCVFIWYNLPNRDCHAKASNGEICCHKDASGACSYGKASDCADGLEEYRTEYADPFIEVLKEYQDTVPIVIVVEPDSLPNLATNLDMPRCGSKATQQAYEEGVKYAIDQLTTHVPKASVYIDAAHGGWLGWEDNIEKFMNLLKKMDLPLKGVRGFSTNVANYQPLGVKCPYCPDQNEGFRNGFCLNGKNPDHPCCTDACDLLGQFNPSNNEMNYALHLVTAADSLLNMNARVVIDTGRSGVDDMRSMCSSWCNPRGGGAGIPSTSKTADPSIVDAYFWLKTPGESDGCTEKLPDGSSCPRFDSDCEGTDSIGGVPDEPRAPEAGAWFDYQVKQLAKNAHLDHPKGTHESKAETCEDSKSTSKPKPKYDSDFDGSAAEEFAQCGGEGWTGPTTCAAGCRCTEVNKYWWQCDPPGGEGLCRDEWPDDAPKADSEPISWVVWALSSAGAILGLSSAVVIGYLLWQRQPLVVDPNGQPLQQSRV